jgi:hypothetical protein
LAASEKEKERGKPAKKRKEKKRKEQKIRKQLRSEKN